MRIEIDKEKKSVRRLIVSVFLFMLLLAPFCAFAQTSALDRLKTVGPAGGYAATTNDTSAAAIAGTVIKAFLGMLGVIFIILIVLAGYNWMTAAGDEQKVEKAKEGIKRAIIGLIIITGSYAIWTFIFTKFLIK